MENDPTGYEIEPADNNPAGSIDALIQSNSPALQDILAQAVTDPRRLYRIEAAFRLAELFQDVRAVPALAEALEDDHWNVRKAAGEALWDIGDADTPGLIALLDGAYGQDREMIAGALTRIGWQADDMDAEAAYRVAVRDWRGCVLLGGGALPRLITTLTDPDGAVRRAAAWALGQIGDPAAVDGLAGLLDDTEGDMFGVGDRICDIAAEALQAIGTPDVLAALSQSGFDPSEV